MLWTFSFSEAPAFVMYVHVELHFEIHGFLSSASISSGSCQALLIAGRVLLLDSKLVWELPLEFVSKILCKGD